MCLQCAKREEKGKDGVGELVRGTEGQEPGVSYGCLEYEGIDMTVVK